MSYEPVAPIPVVAPRPSLTTSARELPAGTNWRTGIAFRDTGQHVHGMWPYAAGSSHADKTSDELGLGIVEVRPVTLYVPLDCDFVTLGDEDTWSAEARDALEAGSAFRLARQLAGGVDGDEWFNDPDCDAGINPTLSQPYPGEAFGDAPAGVTNANAVVGTAGWHPAAAFGALLDAYSDATQVGGATIHVEARVLPHLLGNGVVVPKGDLYVGPLNSIVIPHVELVGPATNADGDPDAPAAGNTWMYATGPVEYALGPVQLLPEDRAQRFYGAHRTNRWSVIAERQGITRFNPSVVFAAEALAPTAGV